MRAGELRPLAKGRGRRRRSMDVRHHIALEESLFVGGAWVVEGGRSLAMFGSAGTDAGAIVFTDRSCGVQLL